MFLELVINPFMPPSRPSAFEILIAPFVGELKYSDSDVIHFQEPLIGLANGNRYLLVSQPDWHPVMILQSLDNPQIALSVTTAATLPPLPSDYLTAPLANPAPNWFTNRPTGSESQTGTHLLTLFTVRWDEAGFLRANLLGPLVVDPQQRVGCQLLCEGPAEWTSYPLSIRTSHSGTAAI
jgi:flagellar assembly factor FliW